MKLYALVDKDVALAEMRVKIDTLSTSLAAAILKLEQRLGRLDNNGNGYSNLEQLNASMIFTQGELLKLRDEITGYKKELRVTLETVLKILSEPTTEEGVDKVRALVKERFISLGDEGQTDRNTRIRKVVFELVNSFFKNESKSNTWMNTPNPLLGDVKPNDMILLGREEKLIKFIKVALEENQPPI